jgi:hypothetical protein
MIMLPNTGFGSSEQEKRADTMLMPLAILDELFVVVGNAMQMA